MSPATLVPNIAAALKCLPLDGRFAILLALATRSVEFMSGRSMSMRWKACKHH